MKKQLFKAALQHGPQLLPGVLAFAKRWLWLIILGGIVLALLLGWVAIALLLWAWDLLPQILSYVVNHFAPVWQNLPAAVPLETSAGQQ